MGTQGPRLTASDEWAREWWPGMDDRELRERGLGACHAAALALVGWFVTIALVWGAIRLFQ